MLTNLTQIELINISSVIIIAEALPDNSGIALTILWVALPKMHAIPKRYGILISWMFIAVKNPICSPIIKITLLRIMKYREWD